MNDTYSIGNVRRPAFLSLPERSSKPRDVGLTHVLDKGQTVQSTQSVLLTSAPLIDVWKFGWGTAYIDAGLAEKLALLRAADIRSCLGGTLLEISWAQGKAQECLDWAAEVGFDAVEVSRGVAPMTVADKRELLCRAAESFVVLSEVGSKDPHEVLDPRASGRARWQVISLPVLAGSSPKAGRAARSGSTARTARYGKTSWPRPYAEVASTGSSSKHLARTSRHG